MMSLIIEIISMFVWLVADGWCWFVLREKYGCLVAAGWFVLRENYCWLVADKPSEQGVYQMALWGSYLVLPQSHNIRFRNIQNLYQNIKTWGI
jgi:hypothetical protein